LFIAALFPGRAAAAPEPTQALTLSAIMAEVKTANPALAAARRQLGLLEAEVAINSAYPNPGIEIDKAVSSGSDGYEVKAVQPIPLTRRTSTAAAAARASYESAQKELQALETIILNAARKAWYALRIGKERRDFEEGFLFANAPEATFTGCLLLFLASMTLVTVSRHFGLLWVGIEATTLASAPLIYFHRTRRSTGSRSSPCPK